MDDARFDLLTAALATGSSRRRLLGAFLGAILPGLLVERDAATARRRRRKKKKKCPFGRPACGNDCCTLGEGCLGNRCVHHCRDRRLDGGESDVDCGRVCDGVLGDPGEGLCLRRKRCDGPEDCLSGFCTEVQPGAGKVCTECDSDSHCRDNFGGGPRCLSHFCFECAVDDDCRGQFLNGVCATFSVAAGVNQDPCPPNQPCLCRECRTNDQCPASRPHCRPGNSDPRDGLCYRCLDDLHCPDGNLCEDGECVEFCPGRQRGGLQAQGASCPATCESDDECPSGFCCTDETCVSCPSGCCDSGECIQSFDDDINHCGACGRFCNFNSDDFLTFCFRCCDQQCRQYPRAGNPDCDCPP